MIRFVDLLKDDLNEDVKERELKIISDKLDSILNSLTDTFEDRKEVEGYFEKNNFKSTSLNRNFESGEKFLKKALYHYSISKRWLNKLR